MRCSRGLFALEPGGVEGADSVSDLLWFSVQTLSTIGYGGMTPATPFANLLVIVESFLGLAGVAVVTAILYAKFSLPDARIQFARTLAIHDYKGVPTLHLRVANERTTPILDAELHVGALIDESEDDLRFRRLYDVPLVRSRIPLFAMAFTAMHVLDEDSPLRRLVDRDRLEFLIVTLRGVDARTLQPVFTRALFGQEQVRFGMGFDDMVTHDANASRTWIWTGSTPSSRARSRRCRRTRSANDRAEPARGLTRPGADPEGPKIHHVHVDDREVPYNNPWASASHSAWT